MKGKLGFLIMIAGGVAMAFTGFLNFLPFIVFSVIGGAAISVGIMLFTSVYGGTIWGIKVKAPATASLFNIISIVCLFFGGYSAVAMVIGTLASLSAGRFIELIIYIVLFGVCLAVAPLILKRIMEKWEAKNNHAMCLEQFQIFKEIESRIDEANYFVVSFEGVALFSSTNYCYEVFLYENYQLGELSCPEEVALVGTYFVQKYSDKFKFKVDMEVIPGEPGQTVVAVGTGGISVARTQGTPDQHIFRSYIFTRK